MSIWQDLHAGRERLRRHPVLRPAYRSVVLLVGITVAILGIVLLVLPGPGWLLIFIALAILATEFVWAQRLLHSTKGRFAQVRNRARRRGQVPDADGPTGTEPVR